MQKFQDSVFSIVKTSELSPSVFSFLQPTDDFAEQTPLGGILKDTNYGWLALGPKLCVISVKTGLKVASWTFGAPNSSSQTTIVTVVEIPTPLTSQSRQLVVSLSCNGAGQICVFHINGSNLLRCIETEHVLLHVTVCENALEGPLSCFDGVILGGTKSGEIIAFDLNRSSLIQALSDLTQGNDGQVRNENNMTSIIFLPPASILQIDDQREIAIDNDYHLAILLNENSIYDGQFIFYNPDGSIRMKALQAHIRVTSVQYISQLASLAVGFNFGAFQIWNLMTLELEYSSQVNVECLPVTHFGYQEPCDDPRAFCYLWVVYSVIDRFDNEGYPFAVMYSLNYQGKRMLANNKCLYQDFLTSNVRFQVELLSLNSTESLIGGRCISCHTYSIDSTLGEEGEDSLLNLCQLVWECWGEDSNISTQYGHLLFDLDQWYKDQMPATCQLQSNTFMSVTACMEASRDEFCMLDVRVMTSSVTPYSHATRLEEHFYPNSLQYKCVCLSTSECRWVMSSGVQRWLLSRLCGAGPAGVHTPTLYEDCVRGGLTPLYHTHIHTTLDDKRRYLLSVALEAKLISFLRKCAHDWATGAYESSGCTLTFMVDWCWRRAIELKQNAKELTSPLFTSSSLPDRNQVRCLEHCVRQLNELSGLLDSILTKCCNLVVPDVVSEIEEKMRSVGVVSLYFGMVKWFLGVGLLPEPHDPHNRIPYPQETLQDYYHNRRVKLSRLQDSNSQDDVAITKSSPLLYIDQLIEYECGGDLVHNIWRTGGSSTGLYPPPSLYSLLKIYLIPEITEEHKHSLILYLLLDYTMIYDDIRYEEVIRRLMQFPTMFGLSNTSIKATQAFWHLDHRDFDFALDQLQCSTGNTLSEWQHHVVLSSLLAQNKTQAALQYLHVRKPGPLQANEVAMEKRLSDWQSSCDLYLARGLVYQALDVVRLCVDNVREEDRWTVISHFFKGLHTTGHLSKLISLTLTPFEEKSFIKYLEQCNEPQTSDVLVMFYLQHARYIEAQQYHARCKEKPGRKEGAEAIEGWEGSREAVVQVACGGLPLIAGRIAREARGGRSTHALSPVPMSALVPEKSPKDFTFNTTLIQDTIQNTSESWACGPRSRQQRKRTLNVEDTPFICTPKFSELRKSIPGSDTHSTPKRVKLDVSCATPTTPRSLSRVLNVSAAVRGEISALLDMPAPHTPPHWRLLHDTTPQSILKVRKSTPLVCESAPSPVESMYGDSDDDIDTASRHSHLSDSRQLRFTIPTASESGSTPSPTPIPLMSEAYILPVSGQSETREDDTSKHYMSEISIFESPPKKFALDPESVEKKSLKDTVRGRRSLAISLNSSLSDDQNASAESIADIPITLINPRYEKRQASIERSNVTLEKSNVTLEKSNVTLEKSNASVKSIERSKVLVTPEKKEDSLVKKPSGRKSIRDKTPVFEMSSTERQDSPTVKHASIRRLRSRSRTPEVGRSPLLETISELPKQETELETVGRKSIHVPQRTLRVHSRSLTPDKANKTLKVSPHLEPICESPTKPDSICESPTKPDSICESPTKPDPVAEVISPTPSLRSRSRTPDVDETAERDPVPATPKALRSKSKTPDREMIMSPKPDRSIKSKRSLSRMVLEANTFNKSKPDIEETDPTPPEVDTMECTPKKNPTALQLDFSPIDNKSILKSPQDSSEEVSPITEPTNYKLKSFHLPNVSEIFSKTLFDKSVLHSYESSVDESCRTETRVGTVVHPESMSQMESCSAFKDMSSVLTSDSDVDMTELKNVESKKVSMAKEALLEDDDDKINDQRIKRRIIEIEQEINDIEGSISDDDDSGGLNTGDEGTEEDEDGQSDEQSDDDEESDDNDDDDEEAANDDVISISDSTHDEESSSNSEGKLQIDMDPSSQDPIENIQTNIEQNIENIVTDTEGVTDPLNQGNVSLMTDDNSVLISDRSDLDFSHTKDKSGVKIEEEQSYSELRATLTVILPSTFTENFTETIPSKENIDVVDAASKTSSKTAKITTSVTKTDKIPQEDNEQQKTEQTLTDRQKTEEKVKNKTPETPQKTTRQKQKSNEDDISEKNDKMDSDVISKESEGNKSRRRTQSATIVKSDEADVSVSKTRSTRARSTTPKAEVRRILTRRASKELSESQCLDESVKEEMIGSKRRATRSRSRSIEDSNVGLDTSENKSISETTTEPKRALPVRGKRKSVLATRPELSAIPELVAEDAPDNIDNQTLMTEITETRRLTRHQKSMLQTWLEDSGNKSATESRKDTPIIQNKVAISESPENLDHSSVSSESISIDVSFQRRKRSRLTRAASESKTMARAAKLPRRISVDTVNTSERSESPYRTRRASFNKACEALSTPKARRPSTELKRSETDSSQSSPVPSEVDPTLTPSRRTRRTSSTQSNNSRSKK